MSRPELPRAGLLPGAVFRAHFALLALAGLAASPRAQVGSVISESRFGSGSQGYPPALGSGDKFGSGVASFGDRDGDGSLDLLVGTPNGSSTVFQGGAVYLLSFLPDDTVVGSLEISTGAGGFTGTLTSGDCFGDSIAVLGDVDGDGIDDAAVGAPGTLGSDGTTTRVGAVWVLLLNADGTVKDQVRIGDGSGGFGGALSSGNCFGTAVAPLGDLDGDGTVDMAVGAPDSFASLHGKVWILFLRPDGTVQSEVSLDSSTSELSGLFDSTSVFGQGLACAGDVDGDGLPDLFVGAPHDTVISTFLRGSVVVFGLSPSGTVVAPRTIDLIGAVGPTGSIGRLFGLSVAVIGDLVGDGGWTLAVGARQASTSSSIPLTPQVTWNIDLDPLGVPRSFHEIDPTTGSLVSPVSLSAQFGVSLAGVGDRDGDGTPDMVVGASHDSLTGPSNVGALYFLRLSDGDPAADFTHTLPASCAPATIDFTDTSTGAGLSSWSWSFGDGASSTDENPTHVYASSGTYDVVLTVNGSDGVARRVEKAAIVVPDTPVADFSAAPTTVPQNYGVDFTDLSSVETTAWLWDFGDGTTSSLQNPNHAYALDGTYDVSLTASCATGSDVETKRDYIVVLFTPPASVTSCNGSGVNPEVLTSLNDPVIGTTWTVQVDGSALGASGLAFFLSYQDPLSPGLQLGLGELLIDPTSPFVALDIVVLTGGVGTHSIAIPGDFAYLGFTASVQDLLNNVGGSGQLTNRLDVVLGV